jgi:hypothetical protein
MQPKHHERDEAPSPTNEQVWPKPRQPPPVPPEYVGKWIAWDRAETRILASGETFEEVQRAAVAAGESEPVVEKIPPHGYGSLQVPPLIEQAQEAFRRDLTQLLQERPGQWVGYAGPQRLGFAKTQTELYQECLRRGLRHDEFLVRCIEPEVDLYTFGFPGFEEFPLDETST